MRRFSYLYPVKDLLIAGHVLQDESLQLTAELHRRQDLFRQTCHGTGAVRQNELELLFIQRHREHQYDEDEEMGYMKNNGGEVRLYVFVSRWMLSALSLITDTSGFEWRNWSPTCCEMNAWTSSPSGRKSVQLRPDSLHREPTVLWLCGDDTNNKKSLLWNILSLLKTGREQDVSYHLFA